MKLNVISPSCFKGDATNPDELNIWQLLGYLNECVKVFAWLNLAIADDDELIWI